MLLTLLPIGGVLCVGQLWHIDGACGAVYRLSIPVHYAYNVLDQ